MNRNDVLETIEKLLRRVLVAKNKIKITMEDHLENDLGIDSIGSVEFVTELEDIYQIEISDEELDSAQTVSGVVNIILEKLAVAA